MVVCALGAADLRAVAVAQAEGKHCGASRTCPAWGGVGTGVEARSQVRGIPGRGMTSDVVVTWSRRTEANWRTP